MFTATVKDGEIEATFRNSILNTIKYRRFSEIWEAKDEAIDEDARILFVTFASYFDSCKGLKFDKVPQTVSVEGLERLYEELIPQISLGYLWECRNAVNELLRPLTTGVETHDDEVTEEQASDPNS